jgi:hypothetical protein
LRRLRRPSTPTTSAFRRSERRARRALDVHFPTTHRDLPLSRSTRSATSPRPSPCACRVCVRTNASNEFISGAFLGIARKEARRGVN